MVQTEARESMPSFYTNMPKKTPVPWQTLLYIYDWLYSRPVLFIQYFWGWGVCVCVCEWVCVCECECVCVVRENKRTCVLPIAHTLANDWWSRTTATATALIAPNRCDAGKTRAAPSTARSPCWPRRTRRVRAHRHLSLIHIWRCRRWP